MLQSIVASPWLSASPDWSLGTLAEMIFFYKKVHLYIGRLEFRKLLAHAGGDLILRLMNEEYVEFHLLTQSLAIAQDGDRSSKFVPYRSSKPTIIEGIQNALREGGASENNCRKLARQIDRRLTKFDLTREFAPNLNLLDQFRMDLASEEYLRRIIFVLHHELWPNQPLAYQPSFHLEIVDPRDGRFRLHTNVNFASLSDSPRFHLLNIQSNLLSHNGFSFLVSFIGFDALIGGMHKSAVLTGNLGRVCGRTRIESALNLLSVPSAKITLFQEMVFPEGRRISEAVANDCQRFREFLDLMGSHESRRFREWLHSIPDFSQDAIREYIKQTSRDSWINDLPAKSFRMIFQGVVAPLVSAIDPIAGHVASTGLAAADSFLLDRLLSGWKPSQFVSGPLSTFLGQPPQR